MTLARLSLLAVLALSNGKALLASPVANLPKGTLLILKQDLTFQPGQKPFVLYGEYRDRCTVYPPKVSADLLLAKGTLVKILGSRVGSDTSYVHERKWPQENDGWGLTQDTRSYDYKNEWLDLELIIEKFNQTFKLRCEENYSSSSQRSLTSWKSFYENREEWNRYQPVYSYVTVVESNAMDTQGLEQFFDIITL